MFLRYTDCVLNCDIHTRARTKRILLANGAKIVCGLDEILNAPIKSVLEILANLSYVLANGNLGTIVENLIAPINVLSLKETVLG